MKEITKEELQRAYNRLSDDFDKNLDYIIKLEEERDQYKKAYNEYSCYFDSISDEEQPKLAKRLDKIFKL